MDMIHGPLAGKILAYALPLAATGILQQLFNAADVAVVGRFVGKEAMAAVGSNSALIGLLVNLFVGISLGTNVVIANATGRGDDEEIRRAVHTSVVIAVIGGLIMTVFGELVSAPVIRFLGVPDDVFAMAVLYLRVYLIGMPVILLYNFTSAIFRSQGDTRTPLIALVISGVLNVFLNLFFVAVMGRTVDGVATATVISNLVSSFILCFRLAHSDSVVRLNMRKLRIHRATMARILKIGVPSGVQGMLFSFANIIIQSAINSLGSTVMAASSAAFNLEIFSYYVMNSFSQACTTFVGQNYGAGKEERCRKTLACCMGLGALFTGTACFLILTFSRQLIGIFNTDPEVIGIARIRLGYMFFSYVFNIFQDVFSGYLRGYGVSFLPAACSVLGICGVRIWWIYTVFRANPTFPVIMQSYPVSLAITGAMVVAVTILFGRHHRRALAAGH